MISANRLKEWTRTTSNGAPPAVAMSSRRCNSGRRSSVQLAPGSTNFNGDIPAAGGAVGQRLPPLVGDRPDCDCRGLLAAKTIPTALCEA
jgi:hypothetical protein